MNKKNSLPKSQQPAVVRPSLQQAGKMVVSLTNLRRDRTHCDVFLQVEGNYAGNEGVGEVGSETRGVWAHSAVLSAVSPYFYDRCKRSFNKCTIQVIFINDVTLETLRELVENIYSATALLVSVEKATELLAAATSLEVREVRDEACECLKRALSADNALGIHASAVRHGCTVLAATATHYIYNHFQQVLEADELLALETDSLIALLDNNRLAAAKESAFDAVLRWMLHHPQDVNLKTLRMRVEYIYSATSLVVSVKKAKELLAAATSLKVAELRDMACVYMQRALSADNVLGVYTSAVTYKCTALAAAAIQYTQNHFQHVLQAEELLELEPDSMNALLNANRLAASNENAFDAVLRWMQHRQQERRQHLVSLLQVVQLPPVSRQISANDEVQIVQEPTIEPKTRDAQARDLELRDLQPPNTLFKMSTTDPELPRTQEQQQHLGGLLQLPKIPTEVLAERACAEPLASAEQCVELQLIEALPACQPRQPHSFALLVVGGTKDIDVTKDVLSGVDALAYELSCGHWQSAAAMPEDRKDAGIALLHDHVYVVGGYYARQPQRSVFIYDVVRGSWTRGPLLRTSRWGPGVAALGGRLYAVSGLSGAILSSVEALDPREGVWRDVTSMAAARGGDGVAALDGRLYAAGGFDGRDVLNTVERYDPSADRWEPAESMTQRREDHGVVAVEDTLYAVGGADRLNRLRSVERYRVGSGWEPAPSMTVTRNAAAVTTHAGRVYVAGGYDDLYNILCSVSVFDPGTAAWTELPAAIPGGRASAAAVVVDWPPRQAL